MKSGLKFIMAALLGGTAIVVVPKAVAQEIAPAGETGQSLEVIVVTAEKRSTTVQTTAASISAFSGEDLQDRGITSFSDLAQSTPGVSLKSEGPSQTEIEMRGMTSSGGNSPTVGFYIDDVPLTGPAGAQNGHVVISPSLYDLNRIEVLRGPQGTLYGSASMGGTVRLITNQPDTNSFQATAESILSGTEGGSFNHDDNVMLNIPLVDDELALRVVGTENFTSGWIDRIVANPFPLVSTNGAVRGDVSDAPIEKQYPGSNADQLYGTRASVLWKPLPNLTITPSYFFQTDKQDGISAYDSDPGTMAHYQPFDIAEPLSDKISILSLDVDYSFDAFDVTSSTAEWWRRSMQTEDSSEDFNNPDTGVTFASNNGLPNPGYYGPNGTGEVYGTEVDPSRQLSEELRVASKGEGPLTWVAGAYYSHFHSLWTFNGTTLNPSAYMDLGTFAPATTTNWFDAVSPTTLTQYALFGDATYAFTSQLKAEIGLRRYTNDYTFSSCISGWGSGLGAATPSCSGLVKQSDSGINPKLNLSYEVDADTMFYATIARGSRPGGGDAVYPTTGAYWSAVFAPFNYTNGKWPTSYKPDSVWSYELGEKTELFHHRLILNTSVYYEDWSNIQLEAYPGDWALNINGKSATIYGGEIEAHAALGEGFELSASTSYTNATMDPGPHWQIVPLHRLPEIAPLTADLILSYTRELTNKYVFVARAENSYTGQRRSLAFPFGNTLNGAYIPVAAYDLTNIRAGIQSDDSWSATLFVNNLFNKHAQLESLYQETLPSASFNRIVTNQPLTAGIDLTYSY